MPAAKSSSSAPNVYTALAIVATIALAVGVAYLWMHNTAMTGVGNPFQIIGK